MRTKTVRENDIHHKPKSYKPMCSNVQTSPPHVCFCNLLSPHVSQKMEATHKEGCWRA